MSVRGSVNQGREDERIESEGFEDSVDFCVLVRLVSVAEGGVGRTCLPC